MKTDFFFFFCKRYFGERRCLVELKLTNGTCISGKISGFMKGDLSEGEPYIIRWILVNSNDQSGFGMDAFGYLNGKWIWQNEIASVKFLSDQTRIDFRK